jgi:threonine/homoserine/homoserine lactone efflux protein
MQIAPEERAKTSYWQAIRDGAVIATFNPKLMLFFIAIFAPFVGSESTTEAQALLVVTPWMTDTLWYIIVALLLSTRKSLALLAKHEQRINRGMAIALTFLASVMLSGLL